MEVPIEIERVVERIVEVEKPVERIVYVDKAHEEAINRGVLSPVPDMIHFDSSSIIEKDRSFPDGRP